MRIQASNREHRDRYEVYLDGVNVSAAVMEADDVAHVVKVVIRDDRGQVIRGPGNRILTSVIHGHVTIVPKVNEPAILNVS